MTGFGSASRTWESPDGPATAQVEVRSVNSRFLEIKVRQPFGPKVEQALRGQLQKRIVRGRVDVAISIRRGTAVEQDADALSAAGVPAAHVRQAIAAVAETARIADEASLATHSSTPAEILRFAHAVARAGAGEGTPDAPPFLQEIVREAVDELCQFREREGVKLGEAIATLADELRDRVAAMAALLPAEEKRIAARLTQKVTELCERAGTDVASPDRIAQEVALLVAKGDVAEELARIESHLQQLRETLQRPPQKGQGKALDFVTQELLREVTTIGSKITSHDGSRIVIEAKGIIERIREQVQNVQ